MLHGIAPKVSDVAAHLLDTALRKLSMVRDSCFVEAVEIRSPQDVVALVNRLNQEGVTVYRRLSPAVLIGMMKVVIGVATPGPRNDGAYYQDQDEQTQVFLVQASPA